MRPSLAALPLLLLLSAPGLRAAGNGDWDRTQWTFQARLSDMQRLAKDTVRDPDDMVAKVEQVRRARDLLLADIAAEKKKTADPEILKALDKMEREARRLDRDMQIQALRYAVQKAIDDYAAKSKADPKKYPPMGQGWRGNITGGLICQGVHDIIFNAVAQTMKPLTDKGLDDQASLATVEYSKPQCNHIFVGIAIRVSDKKGQEYWQLLEVRDPWGRLPADTMKPEDTEAQRWSVLRYDGDGQYQNKYGNPPGANIGEALPIKVMKQLYPSPPPASLPLPPPPPPATPLPRLGARGGSAPGFGHAFGTPASQLVASLKPTAASDDDLKGEPKSVRDSASDDGYEPRPSALSAVPGFCKDVTIKRVKGGEDLVGRMTRTLYSADQSITLKVISDSIELATGYCPGADGLPGGPKGGPNQQGGAPGGNPTVPAVGDPPPPPPDDPPPPVDNPVDNPGDPVGPPTTEVCTPPNVMNNGNCEAPTMSP